MEFLTQYGLFLAKTVTLVVALFILIGSLVSAGSKLKKAERKGYIDGEKLNDHYEDMKEVLLTSTQNTYEYKKYLKVVCVLERSHQWSSRYDQAQKN